MEKSLIEIYQKYKSNRCRKGSDKGSGHTYIDVYDKLFSEYRDRNVSLLEIGVASGKSLVMWKEYFHNSFICGIDKSAKPTLLNNHDDIKFFQFNSINLNAIKKNLGKLKFDIIIDDASHALRDQLLHMSYYRPYLKNGGIYVIEDIHKDNKNYFSVFKEAEIMDMNNIRRRRYPDNIMLYVKL